MRFQYDMPRNARTIVRHRASGVYVTKKNSFDATLASLLTRGRTGTSEVERVILKADIAVKDALTSMKSDQKAIDALTGEIKATQARTKAILDTF